MIAQTINRLFGTRTESPVGRTDPRSNFWYQPVGSWAASSSGVAAGPDAAMGIGTAYRCIQVMADTVGAMPWHIFQDTDGEKSKAEGHEFYETLHTSPNVWQTPIEFKSTAVVHLMLRGNFYARRDNAGLLRESPSLVPLDPDRMRIEQLSSGRLNYRYTDSKGQPVDYPQERIYHVKLMSRDGVTGMTGASYAAEVIGVTLAQMRYNATMYGNGGFFKYYLSTDKHLGTEGIKNFREGWRDVHGGGKFAPPILEDGLDLKPLGMTMEDAQFFETRSGYGVEVCQFFGVPPHLAFLDNDSKANMEQKGGDFLRYSLDPLLVRFEQAVQPFVGDGYFSQFNRDAIVRPSLADRYDAHAVALGGRAFKSVDEVREKEDLPPLGGDADELPPPPNQSIPADGAKQASQKFNNRAADEDDTEARAVDLSPLVRDAAERIVTREVEHLGRRAVKAATNRAAWNVWAVSWYESHARYVAEVITPIVDAAGCHEFDPVPWSMEYCEAEYFALDGQPVAETLAEWKTSKAATVAAQITEAMKCTTTS